MKNLTYKSFVDFVNKEFERMEIKEFVAISCRRSFFTTDQYESGACRLYVHFALIDKPNIDIGYFLCFYSLKEYNEHIKAGYEMYLTLERYAKAMMMHKLTVELRKK